MAEYKADFLFAVVPVALLDDPAIKADHIAAYIAIRSFCTWGSDTGARVRDETAARRAGMSPRNFGRARQQLRAAGWLDWSRTGRTNVYVVRSAKLAEQVELVADQKRQVEDENGATLADQNGQDGRSAQTDWPSHTKQEGSTKIQRTRGGRRRAHLVPFTDLHRELLGGPMQTERYAKTFTDLLQTHSLTDALAIQRAYLEDLLAHNSVKFLNYNTMAAVAGNWLEISRGEGRPPTAKADRLTSSTKNKDFLR